MVVSGVCKYYAFILEVRGVGVRYIYLSDLRLDNFMVYVLKCESFECVLSIHKLHVSTAHIW